MNYDKNLFELSKSYCENTLKEKIRRIWKITI